MTTKKILLLTLVHPAFLPPVTAMAQVLKAEGYEVTILTFDPHIATEVTDNEGIVLESVGKHHGIGLLQRLKIRRKYTARAKQIVAENTTAIISFCAFTYLCGLKVRKQHPLIYHALEMADFIWKSLPRSPLSQVNNYLALSNVHKATLVTTPSAQRSAWLAGRCKLSFLPETIQNTTYVSAATSYNHVDTINQLIPLSLQNKVALLYMGSVNELNCVAELVEAFCKVDNENCVLLIAGMRDNSYCNAIKQYAATQVANSRIVFYPYVAGKEKEGLLQHAAVGVSLTKENSADIESKMTAPNKAGEYLAKNLYLIGTETEYMKQFKFSGVASLVSSPTPENITTAVNEAVAVIATGTCKNKIEYMVTHYYSMQQQMKPITNLLQKL
jgi:hypothetical protein